MALRPNCEGADLPLLVSNSLDHLCAPEPGFSETAIPPGAAHYGRNGFAGSARSLGDAQTIEIDTLALDNDVGFAFAKSGQSRVLFRDWSVGSVVAKQIWNPSSVTAQEPPGYSRPKPSICFGFVLRSVGERGAPLMQPIRPRGSPRRKQILRRLPLPERLACPLTRSCFSVRGRDAASGPATRRCPSRGRGCSPGGMAGWGRCGSEASCSSRALRRSLLRSDSAPR